MSVGGPPDPAVASVAALIGDIAHVVREIPRHRWAEVADALSEHHAPPVDRAALADEHGQIQDVAHDLIRIGAGGDDLTRATLEAMSDRVERLVIRWNATVADDRRLLVAQPQPVTAVIDLRVDDDRALPEFIEPQPHAKWSTLRRLGNRLR